MGRPGSFWVVWVVFRYAGSSLVFLEKIEVIIQEKGDHYDFYNQDVLFSNQLSVVECSLLYSFKNTENK